MNLFMFIGFKIWGMGAVEKVFIATLILFIVSTVIQGIIISPRYFPKIAIKIVEWIIFMLLGYPPKPIMIVALITSIVPVCSPIDIILNLIGLIFSYIFVF